MRQRGPAGPTKDDMQGTYGLPLVLAELARRQYYGMEPGTQGELGSHLGISKQAVNQWKAVPAKYVLDVADLLGLPPEFIRPDVFSQDKTTRAMHRCR